MQSSDWGPARKAVLEPQRDRRMQMNPGVEPLWHQIPAQFVFYHPREKQPDEEQLWVEMLFFH